MPENQAHGKIWEKDLGMNVYKATEAELKSVSHTAPIDVPRAFNRLDGTDISVKVSGTNAIDMGDIERIYKEVSSGESIHMTVVCWEQKNPTTKALKSITEVDLTNSVVLLFGTATLSDIQALVACVKAIPKNARTAEHTKTYKQMAATLKQRHGGLIHYAPKVDTKNQRRVQGRISKFSEFLQKHPERIVAQSQNGEFRGGKITEEILSTKRVRSKKPAPDSAPR